MSHGFQQDLFDRTQAKAVRGRGGLGFSGGGANKRGSAAPRFEAASEVASPDSPSADAGAATKRSKVVVPYGGASGGEGAEDVVRAVVTATAGGGAAAEHDGFEAAGGAAFDGLFDGVEDTADSAAAAAGGSGAGAGAGGTGDWRQSKPHNSRMHPRNEYRGKRPDFAALAAAHPSFAPFVKLSKSGAPTVDWKDPYANRELTTVLLLEDFKIHWKLPINHLCPPLPNRLNYVHWVEDLLRQSVSEGLPPKAAGPVVGIDIGTGASCIYPLLGHRIYGWSFVATDIDPESIACANTLVEANSMQAAVRVCAVAPGSYLQPAVAALEEASGGGPCGAGAVSFCMCNPPFFDTPTEAGANPLRATSGTLSELVTPGGEAVFVAGIIADSAVLKTKVIWYTTMVGKKSTLESAGTALVKAGVTTVRTTTFYQGKTLRWGLAWSFFPPSSFTTATPSPTGETLMVVEKCVKAFDIEGVTRDEVASRVLQCLQERSATAVPRSPALSADLTWACVCTHVPKATPVEPAAGAGAGSGAGAGVGAAAGAGPLQASVDNLFRFEVTVCAASGVAVGTAGAGAAAVGAGAGAGVAGSGLRVSCRFVAGLNRTKETFWHLADALDADVRRTNRAWRRRAQAQAQAQA